MGIAVIMATMLTDIWYAYNGEARDSTGLDYLRARYYDSSAGTFLTEDSYSGVQMDPLSQNGYAYVSNNPINYTDPSGHFLKGLVKGAKKAVSKAVNTVTRVVKNTVTSVEKAATNVWNSTKQVASKAWNGVIRSAQTVYHSAQQSYQSTSQYVSGQFVYNRGVFESKEAANITTNYGISKNNTVI